ncbi:unnamed protein product, partial [Phaeothamnion confervicola]
MPPKKKSGDKKAANGEPVLGEDPLVFLREYQKFARLIGVKANAQIVAALQDEENFPVEQLVINDEQGPLGPGGTRALTTALLGNGPEMRGGSYKLLKSLRMWRARCGDDGTACLAELLRLGGAAEVRLEYLELFDDEVGPKGALALGNALSIGCNQSLLTLKLDYNPRLGSDGAAALCRGLRTNAMLRQLHLPYCGVGPEGGGALGEVLAYGRCHLTVLNLQGNRIGADGLARMAPGLARNASLAFLSVADNEIGGCEADATALETFRDAMVSC